MASIEERLTTAEEAINRMLEALQDVPTVEDASEHVLKLDDNAKNILYRITSIESKIAALKYIWQQAYKTTKS